MLHVLALSLAPDTGRARDRCHGLALNIFGKDWAAVAFKIQIKL